MSGIVWLTYVRQLAIWPASTMRACISGSSIIACWIWPNRVQSSALESTPMVLVASPPTMVTSVVTFSAPCLRARSFAFLSCFCKSPHWTPGFGWIVTNETMVIVEPPLITARILAFRPALRSLPPYNEEYDRFTESLSDCRHYYLSRRKLFESQAAGNRTGGGQFTATP